MTRPTVPGPDRDPDPDPDAPASRAAPGLRERKKAKTRRAIRSAAFRLFAERGYDATSVEQISAAAEVSPSTFSRYFPAKEDVVLPDGYDPDVESELLARPAGEPLLEAVRHATAAALQRYADEHPEETAQRTRLLAEVPAVRARMAEGMQATRETALRMLAERMGRDPGDLEVRVAVGSLLGAVGEATLYWAERGGEDDLLTVLGRALDVLASGLEPRDP